VPAVILAIDPGSSHSAIVVYDHRTRLPTAHARLPNADVIARITDARTVGVERVVVEMIASYGMAVGAEVFETCVWVGRFIQAADHSWLPADRIYRREVKMHLCGHARAKDTNVRQALIDLYGPTKAEAVGTKMAPGPLYGFRADEWAALAVARTYADTRMMEVPFHP